MTDPSPASADIAEAGRILDETIDDLHTLAMTGVSLADRQRVYEALSGGFAAALARVRAEERERVLTIVNDWSHCKGRHLLYIKPRELADYIRSEESHDA